MHTIDLRSDTVTKPTPAMREAMVRAAVGDDVYGEDPTVNELQELGARLLGKEAALFTPSGTQANLLALLSHCERGDEYIAGQHAHTYKYEAGGGAVLGSIQPQPLDFEPDGTLDLDKVAATIKQDDFHFARTRLLCLENTHYGLALPLDYLDQLAAFGACHNLRLHLDGARIFNAAIKQGVDAKELCAPFDTVSCCLSKGLGAPVGSLLCGDKPTIERARRWRKMVGGGMRQAGIIAAAGIHALTHHVERLQEDHDNAALLADGLRLIESVQVDYDEAQTNMVFITVSDKAAVGLPAFLAERGIIIPSGTRIRLVTHLDVDRSAVERTVEAMRHFFIHLLGS
jgi:threonine aldolase